MLTSGRYVQMRCRILPACTGIVYSSLYQMTIVTLVDQFRHKEVYLLQEDPETAKMISRTIGSAIHHKLEEVCKFLKYSRSISSLPSPRSQSATWRQSKSGQWW